MPSRVNRLCMRLINKLLTCWFSMSTIWQRTCSGIFYQLLLVTGGSKRNKKSNHNIDDSNWSEKKRRRTAGARLFYWSHEDANGITFPQKSKWILGSTSPEGTYYVEITFKTYSMVLSIICWNVRKPTNFSLERFLPWSWVTDVTEVGRLVRYP